LTSLPTTNRDSASSAVHVEAEKLAPPLNLTEQGFGISHNKRVWNLIINTPDAGRGGERRRYAHMYKVELRMQ
jgi:hypothetical protein